MAAAQLNATARFRRMMFQPRSLDTLLLPSAAEIDESWLALACASLAQASLPHSELLAEWDGKPREAAPKHGRRAPPGSSSQQTAAHGRRAANGASKQPSQHRNGRTTNARSPDARRQQKSALNESQQQEHARQRRQQQQRQQQQQQQHLCLKKDFNGC